MPNSPHLFRWNERQDAWLQANPELDNWLNHYTGDDRFIRSMRNEYTRCGWLSAPQTNALIAAMEQDLLVPASMEDLEVANWAFHIPNGRYQLREYTGPVAEVIDPHNEHSMVENHRFQIYTVTRGSLVYKRIIKLYNSNTDQFKGFGFITTDGQIKLWRSHEQFRGANWVKMARFLVSTLHNNGQGYYTYSSPIVLSGSASSVLSGGEHTQYILDANFTCQVCNHTVDYAGGSCGSSACHPLMVRGSAWYLQQRQPSIVYDAVSTASTPPLAPGTINYTMTSASVSNTAERDTNQYASVEERRRSRLNMSEVMRDEVQ